MNCTLLLKNSLIERLVGLHKGHVLFHIEYFLNDFIIHMYTEYSFYTQGVMKGSLWIQAKRGVSKNEILLLKTGALLLFVRGKKANFTDHFQSTRSF